MMTEKKSKAQDSHDACVRTVADELKRDNWAVKADLEGYEKPSAIGKGYLPDVQAEKKGCLTRICEVATLKCLKATCKGTLNSKITATNMTSTCTW